MRLWSVEGNRQRLDGGAMYGNAPRALWEKWTPPDAQNRIEFACRCLLVRDVDGKTVLFETGIGAFFEPKLRSRYGVHEHEHVLLQLARGAWRRARGRRRRRARAICTSITRAACSPRSKTAVRRGCCFRMRASSSAGAHGSARAARTRAIARRSSPRCRRCSSRAAVSSSSTARAPRRSATRCVSSTPTATRRASRTRRSAATAASCSAPT